MDIQSLNDYLLDKSADFVLGYFLQNYKKVSFSTSLSIEDQVITHMLCQSAKKAQIFTLDTGRMFSETYDILDRTNLKYGIKIKVYFPLHEDVQKLYLTQGVNGHLESVDKRKHCCYIRKVEPLQRALKDVDVWITGLRKEQSVTRDELELVSYDEGYKLIKLNPLANWNEQEIWEYIKKNQIPYNKLYDQNYASIGCEPCTRAIKKGENVRDGRWWWEDKKHKECGLHVRSEK